MVDTYETGVAAELYAASVLMELGWDVLLPMSRTGKYDLAAIDDEGVLKRFQVKRAGWCKAGHTTSEYLRVQLKTKKYRDDDFDDYIVVDPERRMWVNPFEKVKGKSTIKLDKRTKTNRAWTTKKNFNADLYRVV